MVRSVLPIGGKCYYSNDSKCQSALMPDTFYYSDNVRSLLYAVLFFPEAFSIIRFRGRSSFCHRTRVPDSRRKLPELSIKFDANYQQHTYSNSIYPRAHTTNNPLPTA